MQIFNFQFSIFIYFYYFCSVKRLFLFIWGLLLGMTIAAEEPFNFQLSSFNYTIDQIVLDIYNATTELSEVDYEQLQSDLYAIHESPIDLNNTSDEELSQLYFLSPQQIDDILLYAEKHPFESLYELRMIPSLADYEIRDLLPFVKITKVDNHNIMYAREIFAQAKHEIITRVDARNIENFAGADPVYVQTRYRFDYQRRVTFGAQLRRPVSGKAEDLQYGGFIQLRDIGHLHSLVAGNFQASFGQGLVLAPAFRSGKSAYVQTAGAQRNGLRYYSSVDGEGLHGTGATFRWEWNKSTRLDISALYSMQRANDSTWHHVVGANMTMRHKRFEVQLTVVENLWSDSIHPYRNAKYNQHYFRGRKQAVVGASARYNHGWFDVFGEIATTENYKRFEEGINSEAINSPHWGFGTIVGSRFYPVSGVSLVALYRYYSPWFDNSLGYAFSETSRIGDENGGYLGIELTRWKGWRISGYGDVFYFSGPKYGIPESSTIGYDALAELAYHTPEWNLGLRLRAKEKGGTATYSARAMFNWQSGGWSLRTTADANLANKSQMTYGLSLSQDISYDFQSLVSNHPLPICLKFRLQAFDAREWVNRIYLYEHDVLYAFSIPATYGLGGRAYLCLRWRIIPQLAVYLRVSETLYDRKWYESKHPEWSSADHHNLPLPSRTDVHFLLRAMF